MGRRFAAALAVLAAVLVGCGRPAAPVAPVALLPAAQLQPPTPLIMTAEPIPPPTETPVPPPTETPVPPPTETPVPAPTETPIPAPTETPIPPPTAAARTDPPAGRNPSAIGALFVAVARVLGLGETPPSLVWPTGDQPVPLDPTPDPAMMVNGIPIYGIAVMPPEVEANVREIFATGRKLGRNPNRFSKVGDSLTLTPDYLAKFDTGRYNLGIYSGLQPTIDHYRWSFSRYGVAARNGLHAWSALRPGEADPSLCGAEESMVECEVRLHNPSVIIFRLGTNDVAEGDYYERAMRQAVEWSIARGIVPVLGTKADRFEGDNRNNEALRRIAAAYGVPIWDFDVVAGTLPNRGMGTDNVHLSGTPNNDYTQPETFQAGYPVNDLTALFMLDMIRRAVTETP